MSQAGILALIQHITPLSPSTTEQLGAFLSHQTAPKGTLLLEPGKIADKIYFLTKGFAYQYSIERGEKVATYFWFNNDLITNMPSFLAQQASQETIEVLEDSELTFITYQQLQYLYKKHPEFNIVGRIFMERYYMDLVNLGELWRTHPARTRYQKLLAEKPDLFQHATLGQIASYLNISQETLSRIRSPQKKSR